jgi:D-glycero-D-manno-heptose 1,7-bisphosphate phosphatase
LSKAAFLDRDGTIHRDVHYLRHPEDIELFEGTADAIAALKAEGFRVIVVTNQSGVARGYFEEAALAVIHQALGERLREANPGAVIDDFYYCPHHPEGTIERYARICDCRKPAPGLFVRAATEHDLDLTQSFCVGDKARDVEAGLDAGCARAYRIANDRPAITRATGVFLSLADAVRSELARHKSGAAG